MTGLLKETIRKIIQDYPWALTGDQKVVRFKERLEKTAVLQRIKMDDYLPAKSSSPYGVSDATIRASQGRKL